MSVLGGDTAAPTAAARQAAAGPDWTALVAPIDAEIARITADLQLTPAPLSERDVRARMRALRVSLAELAQSPSTETPPADSRAYREIGAFRTTWEALAEAVWSGRPPSQPLEADQWTAVAATFKDAACRNLAPPVRLAGRAWVCMTNEFFKELVRLEGLAEGVTASLREREIAPLRQSVVDAERALATGTAPGATRVSVSKARLDATVRILQTELKVAELRRLDLQRRRALSSDSSSPYGWFLEWSAKTPSRPLWRRAPYVLRADPGSVVRVTFAGATIERTVERGLPDDLPAFFARAVHDAHDQARRLSFDASHRIDIQLVEYEASLERRFPAARTSAGGAASWQQAIEARRQELQRNSIDDIAAPRARLDRARQLAFEAIEGAR